MGASQSRQDGGGKVVYNEVPVQFSDDLLNHLADTSSTPSTPASRQSTLDAHIRSRIQAETDRLRQEEEEIKKIIHKTLEKENIERETKGPLSGEKGEKDGASLHGPALLGELEEVKRKIEKFQAKRGLTDEGRLRNAAESVLACYSSQKSKPLNCWQEVSEFKASVSELERRYVESLRH